MGLSNAAPADKGSGLKATFGRAGEVGDSGERYLHKVLTTSDFPRYTVSRTHDIPSTPRYSKPMAGDVDFLIASGESLLLIDAKHWRSAIYWTGPGGVGMKNLERQKLSQNMEIARSRYRELLPGMTVEALVIFVPTDGRDRVPRSVDFLIWPGGIRSYTAARGLDRIEQLLGLNPEPPHPSIEGLIARTRRG